MKVLLLNKQAKFDFEPLEKFEAGIILSGGEVKMLRGKHGSLNGSHVRMINGEAILLNAQIPPYPYARNEDYDPTRSRKLLLNKSELLKLQQALETKGKAVVPFAVGLSGRHIKVEIAISRGKNQRDRREEIRRRDLDRQTAKDLKW